MFLAVMTSSCVRIDRAFSHVECSLNLIVKMHKLSHASARRARIWQYVGRQKHDNEVLEDLDVAKCNELVTDQWDPREIWFQSLSAEHQIRGVYNNDHDYPGVPRYPTLVDNFRDPNAPGLKNGGLDLPCKG